MNDPNDLLDLDNSTNWINITLKLDSNGSFQLRDNQISTPAYLLNTTDNIVSLNFSSSTKIKVSLITETSKKETTEKMDQDTLYILISAISFVFVTSLVCITMCTIIFRSRRNKLQGSKSNKSGDSFLNVGKGHKSSLGSSSTSFDSSKLSTFKNLPKEIRSQIKTSPNSKLTVYGSLDSVNMDSWKSTFSLLSTATKSKSGSPVPTKLIKQIIAEPKKVKSVTKVEPKVNKSLIVDKSFVTSRSLIGTNKSVIGESSKKHNTSLVTSKSMIGESLKGNTIRSFIANKSVTAERSNKLRKSRV